MRICLCGNQANLGDSRCAVCVRDKDLRSKFGISKKQYDEIANKQLHRCAICLQPETVLRKNKALPLVVDHDHKTGVIRELLCSQCNKGVGQFNDDPILMRKAAEYLRSWL
jgi:ribosomal protein S14